MAKIEVPKPRITRAQLVERLDALGVPRGSYSLYGTGAQADGFCLDQLPLGRWVVYFAERGSRGSEHVFDDEGEACRELFSRLKDDEVLPQDATLL